jgi:hypothetical protein
MMRLPGAMRSAGTAAISPGSDGTMEICMNFAQRLRLRFPGIESFGEAATTRVTWRAVAFTAGRLVEPECAR